MIRAGVVGVGHIGCFHAEKYTLLPDVELVGVYDRDQRRAAGVSARLGTRSFRSLEALLAEVDMVSVAVPAVHHFAVARDCLRGGAHVLLEKPMAASVAGAQALTDLAQASQRLLQIGYLERFNPVVTDLSGRIGLPPLIIARRAGPYAQRGHDVDVVMDLMVHDIDVLFEIMGCPATVMAAGGASVLSGKIDVASVTLGFANGCTAHLTADRVADHVERQMQFFDRDQRLQVDFTRQIITSHRYCGTSATQPQWLTETIEFPPTDALLFQIEDFVACVRTGRPPRVDGEQGLRTLAIAEQIRDMLAAARAPALHQPPALLDAAG